MQEPVSGPPQLRARETFHVSRVSKNCSSARSPCGLRRPSPGRFRRTCRRTRPSRSPEATRRACLARQEIRCGSCRCLRLRRYPERRPAVRPALLPTGESRRGRSSWSTNANPSAAIPSTHCAAIRPMYCVAFDWMPLAAFRRTRTGCVQSMTTAYCAPTMSGGLARSCGSFEPLHASSNFLSSIALRCEPWKILSLREIRLHSRQQNLSCPRESGKPQGEANAKRSQYREQLGSYARGT